MMRPNFLTETDSYKLTHHEMLPDDIEAMFYYLEAREGGDHDRTCFAGLQPYLQRLAGPIVTNDDIAEAKALAGWHFNGPHFNEAGWRRIVDVHGGRLPIRIRAVPEGTVVPVSNVLLTVETLDPRCAWLDVETLLLKVWYPTTVATIGWHLKHRFLDALERTGGPEGAADYMLHDFGYRGVSSEESACIGGGAHLINFRGTDTINAMRFVQHYYGAQTPAQSVAASQHAVMTLNGQEGEIALALHLISTHQNQILSLVADSFDYYRFVDAMIDHIDLVERCNTRLVIRPDSTTMQHTTPESLVRWTQERQAARLASRITTTATGHRVTPFGVLWGDGLDPATIGRILDDSEAAGFAAQNLVFGMGGGLLQRINRDTDRFAMKVSAVQRHGSWVNVHKTPLQASKTSKAGRLDLVYNRQTASYRTIDARDPTYDERVLETVFEHGVVLRQQTFDDVRSQASEHLRRARFTRETVHA
jgi:nicotinamide phosphoribosyltransferase